MTLDNVQTNFILEARSFNACELGLQPRIVDRLYHNDFRFAWECEWACSSCVHIVAISSCGRFYDIRGDEFVIIGDESVHRERLNRLKSLVGLPG